ncbi:trifunctional dihydropteroate synthetase, partial [Bachmanniomyces sp. S44760]|nr:trifunctional dihydropteroate synthetase [Bachmanniomyces sp. S44760]
MDTIFLRNLRVTAIVGRDAWQRDKAQPIAISIRLKKDLTLAAQSDDVNKTFSYGTLFKDVTGFLNTDKGFSSVRDLQLGLAQLSIDRQWKGKDMTVNIHLPKGHLRVDGGLYLSRVSASTSPLEVHQKVRETFSARGMRLACIIGVNPHERVQKQTVVIDLEISDPAGFNFESLQMDLINKVVE